MTDDPVEEVVERAAEKLAVAAEMRLPQVQRAFWLTRICVLQTILMTTLLVVTLLNMLRLGDVRQNVERTQNMVRCVVAITADPAAANNPVRLAECLKG